MRARPWMLLALLVSSTWLAAANATSADEEMVRVPRARVGDEVVYAAPGSRQGSFAFAWEPRVQTEDRWGVLQGASVLRTVLPRSDVEPEAGEGEWTQLREAFSDGGALLWRSEQTSQSGGGDAAHVHDAVPPMARAEVRRDIYLDRTTYDPGPLVRSCFAHHGLQGRSIAPGEVVDLGTLCPVVAGLGFRSEALPALASTFLGRAAVQLRYDLLEVSDSNADVALPMPGRLRVVLADGLPFLAEVQVSGMVPGGAWHEVLAGVREGSGPAVPAWRGGDGADERQVRPGARFAPLTEAGPADGGSGLPYTLEEAVASVRADVTLVGFQAWLREHPDAFVVRAVYDPREVEGATWANWILYFGGPRGDGWVDVFSLDAYRAHAGPLTALVGQPAPLDYNMDGLPGEPVVADPPGGEPSLDLASALRAWSMDPAADTPGGFQVLTYEASASGLPARWRLERWGGPDTAPEGAILTLDASNGAALERWTTADRLSVSNVEVGEGVRLLVEQPPASAGLPLSAAAAAGGVAAVAALALLAHGGWLAALYSRLKGSELLEHPDRRRIYDLVRAKKGAYIQEIVAGTGVARGTVKYHLRVLERDALVTHLSVGRWRRFYASGSVPHGALRRRAELDNPVARAVYEAVQREPGLPMAEVARRAGLSRGTTHKAVAKLAESGLVERRVQGPFVHILPRDPARDN